MSTHPNQHGTIIHVTSNVMCHITHHMSQMSQKLQNSLGPHVWPEFLVCHIFLETWGKLHYINSRISSMYKSVLCIIDPMCYICILGNHQSPADLTACQLAIQSAMLIFLKEIETKFPLEY